MNSLISLEKTQRETYKQSDQKRCYMQIHPHLKERTKIQTLKLSENTAGSFPLVFMFYEKKQNKAKIEGTVAFSCLPFVIEEIMIWIHIESDYFFFLYNTIKRQPQNENSLFLWFRLLTGSLLREYSEICLMEGDESYCCPTIYKIKTTF